MQATCLCQMSIQFLTLIGLTPRKTTAWVFYINRQRVSKEGLHKRLWHLFFLIPFFLFALAVPFSIIPLGERQSRIPRQSHFQEAGEAWMWTHGSRRVAAEEAGIWLCWISPRCAVCQVREVMCRRRKGGEAAVKKKKTQHRAVYGGC